MEETHVGSHIVRYDESNEMRLVVRHLQRLRAQGDDQVEEWFAQAARKAKPKITDVDDLSSKKRFTLKHQEDGTYTVEVYKSAGWFG